MQWVLLFVITRLENLRHISICLLLKTTKKSVLISAAHILFDKQTGQAFKHCQYRPQNKRLSGVDIALSCSTRYNVANTNKITQAENDIIFLMLDVPLQQPALELSQQYENKQGDNLSQILRWLPIMLTKIASPTQISVSAIKSIQPLSQKLHYTIATQKQAHLAALL